MKAWWQNVTRRLTGGGDKTLRLLVGVGIAGMLLLAVSEWIPHRRSVEGSAAVTVTARQVEQALEQRITDLLSTVAGVGRCRVLVTLESEERAVYAADTTDTTTEGGGSSSSAYLTVDTQTGPVGLLLTRIQPTVRGVVVVCAGGENPAVCARVQAVITTAFHISERRVCVVPQK